MIWIIIGCGLLIIILLTKVVHKHKQPSQSDELEEIYQKGQKTIKEWRKKVYESRHHPITIEDLLRPDNKDDEDYIIKQSPKDF